jgi:hypothetical protein
VVTDAEFAKAAKNYQTVKRNGQTFYCRRESPMGSRLPSTVCLSEVQLVEEIRNTREVTNRLRNRRTGPCENCGS